MGGAPPEAEGLQARVAALEAEGLARVAALELEERAPAGEAEVAAAAEGKGYFERVSKAVAKLHAWAEGLRARCRPQRQPRRRASGAEPEWYEAIELDLQASFLEQNLKEVAQAKAELETALRVHRAAEVASRDPGWRD